MKEIIKQWRKKAGLSQKELAEKLFLTPSAISQYESGKREPNFHILKQIADVCNQPFTIQIQEELIMKKINEKLAKKEMIELASAPGLINLDEEDIEQLINLVKKNESIYINRKSHSNPKKAVVYTLADFLIEEKPLSKAKGVFACLSGPAHTYSFDDLEFFSKQIANSYNKGAHVIIGNVTTDENSEYEVTIIGLGY